jgi:Holliday junction resolvase RusA-like endonuclease
MTFTLPFLPPSTNHAYINTRRGRVLSPAARKWLADTALIMRAQMHGQPGIVAPALGVMISLMGKWKTKDGKWRKTDISNRVKLLEDAAFAVIRRDDSEVVSLTVRKVMSEVEKTIISIQCA